MTYNHKIGWLIRSARESRGYSQDYMAEMLKICQSAYANLEAGKTTISLDRLIQISQVLEIDIHDIISKSIGDQNFKALENNNIDQPSGNDVYSLLIASLRNEIEFLRTLVKHN